jgi:hypothetical protein
MTRLLIAWEDEYFKKLDPFVKKRVAARAPAGVVVYPVLLSHTTYGAGGFKRYVSSTWDMARSVGQPSNPGLIDHLICVVDGDKLHEQVDTIPRAPVQANAVGSWLAGAESAWQNHLRGLVGKAPKLSVHGVILCWCKESLVLAGYDRGAAKRHLGIDVQASGEQAFLRACKPPPASVPDALFSATFRKPQRCLDEMAKARSSGRTSAFGKNALEFDDMLTELAREDSAIVAGRVPDLDRLADLIWRLAGDAGAATAGTTAAASASPSGKVSGAAKGRPPTKAGSTEKKQAGSTAQRQPGKGAKKKGK